MKGRIVVRTFERLWLPGAARNAQRWGRGGMMGWLALLVWGSLHAQEPGFRLEGMISRELPVTGRKMTNVIFPVDIAAGVRVSRDVLVQKVRGVENVIELKALKRDFAPTNLAVYGKDGRLYSFVLHYVEDTTVFDYRVVPDGAAELPVRLTGWPVPPERLRADGRMLASRRGFGHRRASRDGMRLRLTGIYLRDSLLWLTTEVENRMAMGCLLGGIRVYAEDRKRVRRTASQELDVPLLYKEGFGDLPGFGRRVMAVAMRPFLAGRGKRLVIALSDGDGDRQVVLKVRRKVLLHVRRG